MPAAPHARGGWPRAPTQHLRNPAKSSPASFVLLFRSRSNAGLYLSSLVCAQAIKVANPDASAGHD